MAEVTLDVIVHHDHETGQYWASVVQLPGCFAAGHTKDELLDALSEAVQLYLEDADPVVTEEEVEVERYQLAADRRLIPA
jgi:predicted RNase H-like HicB family nuclease